MFYLEHTKEPREVFVRKAYRTIVQGATFELESREVIDKLLFRILIYFALNSHGYVINSVFPKGNLEAYRKDTSCQENPENSISAKPECFSLLQITPQPCQRKMRYGNVKGWVEIETFLTFDQFRYVSTFDTAFFNPRTRQTFLNIYIFKVIINQTHIGIQSQKNVHIHIYTCYIHSHVFLLKFKLCLLLLN